MFDDARLEKLENLYDKYDSAITKKEKRLVLNEILEINPTDIDSMHRLVDLLPEKQQLDALLKLKEDARQKEPLIVPDYQMESLKIICAAEEKDVLILPYNVQKFSTGQKVRIIDGEFKNVEGRVARFQKQQRVGIIIEGLLTVATAYIPSAFLQAID